MRVFLVNLSVNLLSIAVHVRNRRVCIFLMRTICVGDAFLGVCFT
jgi:hypothetical protein